MSKNLTALFVTQVIFKKKLKCKIKNYFDYFYQNTVCSST